MNRVEHQVRVSPSGRFKATIEALGKTTIDPDTAWSSSKIKLIDLAKDEVIGESFRDHPKLEVVGFFTFGALEFLLISEDWQGGYGVIDCTSGEKKTWQPEPDQEDVWCWFALEKYEYDEDLNITVLTILGRRIEDTELTQRQFVIEENPMQLPWRKAPLRSVDV